MVDAVLSFTDFSSGEVSPKLAGRVDLKAYYTGAKRIENFICQTTGAASFRTGLVYSETTKSNKKAFLWVFEFSADIAFILEFTDQKLRFYTNDGIVESGGVPVEVNTPYLEADLFELKFAQNGLSLYIAHPNYAPRVLTYTSPTSWALTAQAAYKGNGSSQNITGITKANPAVVTYAGGDNFANGDKVFIRDVVGMTQVNDLIFTVANVVVGSNTFELSGIDSTSYSTWVSGGTIQKIQDAGFLSSGSYPAAVTFFEERLVYGGGDDAPQTLYFSRPSLPDNFVLGNEVDDAIEYTANGYGNTIRWLQGTANFLAVGTFGDVLQATGGTDGVITPTSISVKPSNGYGVADINPVGRGSQIFYMQRNNLIMRSFEYDFNSDGYIPVDRNVIADHITTSGVTQIAFQEGRPNAIWAVKNNGDVIGMTLEEQEGISGWHRHNTQGDIISVAARPRANNYHQLWLCVKRNGNYYIEYMSDVAEFPNPNDYFTGDEDADKTIINNLRYEAQKQYIHLDSALSYYGTSAGEAASAALTPAAISGTGVTFTASTSVFNSGMVGRELWRKMVDGTESGRAVITGYTSGTVVTCEIIEDFDSISAIPAGEWYLTAGTVTGLDHLEGLEVSIVTDGGQHPVRTVSSGSITLDRQSSVVHVGLAYTGYLQTNNLEGGSPNGTAQTKRKNVTAIGVRFLDTLYCKVGLDYYHLDQIEMRTASMRMDRPPIPYTGDTKKTYVNQVNDKLDAGWTREKTVIISQDQPYPCNVQLLIPYVSVS
ncbi:phage stabilization protein [Caudoviricetes sp.]|nr:phage stabilization protein [Caudoviricetes sp.]